MHRSGSKSVLVRCLGAGMLVSIAVFLFGCCPKVTTQEKQAQPVLQKDCAGEAQPAVAALQEARAAARPLRHALVQIFVYGLAIVELKPDFIEFPEEINVHLPFDSGHDTAMFVGMETEGIRSWKTSIPRPGQPDLSLPGLSGATLRLLSPPAQRLEARNTRSNLQAFPANRAVAEDAGWLLRAQQFEPLSRIQAPTGGTHLNFTSGTLETCGLVHSTTTQKVCRVKTGGQGSATRSAAEYIVMRFLVPLDTTSVEIEIDRGPGRKETIKIPARGGRETVTFKDESYDKVFDILVSNLPRTRGRSMDGGHHIGPVRAFFPQAAVSPWRMSSPNCPGNDGEDCNGCVSGVQPACLSYLESYEGQPSGANRPLCPIVGYP
jgi:hypothetical protein